MSARGRHSAQVKEKQKAQEQPKAEQSAVTEDPEPTRGPSWFNRYSEARHVACQQMGIRYEGIEAPRTENDLAGIQSPFLAQYLATSAPKSWEIMTDSL